MKYTPETRPITAMLDGTFDPLHGGHIGQLLRAHVVQPFDKAYILVNQNPTHKPNASALHHRVHMARLGMAAVRNLAFDYEVAATDNTYEFSHHTPIDYKVTGPDSVISDIADQARHPFLTRWPMIVVSYPDASKAMFDMAVAAAPDELRGKMTYQYVDESHVPLMNYDFATGESMTQRVHSTDIRNGNFQNLVPPTVQEYIHEHHLYGNS